MWHKIREAYMGLCWLHSGIEGILEEQDDVFKHATLSNTGVGMLVPNEIYA